MKHARYKVDVTERLVSIYLWYKVCPISDPEQRYYELDMRLVSIYLWYKVCPISDPEQRYYELDI